jgi:hypothetical protein
MSERFINLMDFGKTLKIFLAILLLHFAEVLRWG